jgi:hypothetical protein
MTHFILELVSVSVFEVEPMKPVEFVGIQGNA